MSRRPTGLSRAADGALVIDWDNGTQSRLTPSTLRKACPCASCREKKKADENKPKGLLPILKKEETLPLSIVAMRPVGNYAYGISFSDGHSSGLFTIEHLSELG